MSKVQEILQKINTEPLRRALVLSRDASIDEAKRTVPLSFSSEEPILHWFGYLILDHSPDNCCLERINTSGPLLYAHDRNKKIGVVLEATVDANDKKGRALVQFSKVGLGAEKFQDVIDGIERTISFGFCLEELSPEVGSDGKQMEIDGEPVYRSRQWYPYEISLEPIPADLSIGIGRTFAFENVEQSFKNIITPIIKRELEKTMANENELNNPVQNPAPAVTNPVTVTRSEAEKAQEFVDYGKIFGQEELARDFYNSGKTMAELKVKITEIRSNQTPLQQAPIVDLNKKERQQYSISRAILADANIRDGKADNCFELEVSESARKNAVRNIPNYDNKGGIIIPTNIGLRGARQAMISQMLGLDRRMGMAVNQLALLSQLTRAGLDTLTDTAGQELVFTEEGAFIELLRNRAMVMQLGATVLSGLVGNVAFPKQIGAGTFSWTGENPGSDVGESNGTLDQVILSPKTGQSTTSYSRQLLAQSNVNVDGLVQSDLVQITSLAVDRAAIHGTGSSNQPTGLYATSGIGAVAFGGPITLDKVVDMETAIATANADIGTMAYLTTPGARGKAKKTQEFSSTNGMALWRDGEMNGYRAEASNQVSAVMNASAATGGTSHGILFGVWSQLLFGEWGVMEIITDPYRLKKQGMIEVTNFIMVDIKPRYAEAFCKGTGQSLS